MTNSNDLKDFGKYKAPKRAGELKRRALLVFAVVVLVWAVLDQISKMLVSNSLAEGEASADVIPGIFHLSLTHNTGGAWSILSNATWLLAAFSIVVCIALLIYIVMKGQYLSIAEVIGLGLVCGGGIGNCIDRITQGSVTDFIDLSFMTYPVFNIADVGVVCGIILFVVAYIVRLRTKPQQSSGPSEGKLL